ncbi:MAG: hypothetical protein JXA57_09335 [Armatimonadetes bacterium]|nr:hypothetical protein [Armatimonadota bacterium]
MKGFDPYDALAGSRVPAWVRSQRRARQILIQLRKRAPVDLAPLLGVRPRLIAKALGCFLTAEARYQAAEQEPSPARPEMAQSLATSMTEAVGNCGEGAWGYEFDVQTRWAYYAAGSPNLISTFFVGRALAEAGASFGVDEWTRGARAAAEYLVTALTRRTDDGRPFFAYTPESPRLVHNANLLGAGIVAAVGKLYGVNNWGKVVLRATETTLAAQRTDGSWPYGEGDGLGWSDNFHTAYNLDGLLLVWLATGDPAVRDGLDKGLNHWEQDFFGPSGEPKYCPDRPFPYDIHSAATAIDVAARLATWGFPTAELTRRVAVWTRENLIDPRTGKTYFQKRRFFTDRRNFIRWGEAHWALAQSSLALLDSGRRSPFEAAVEAKRT